MGTDKKYREPNLMNLTERKKERKKETKGDRVEFY